MEMKRDIYKLAKWLEKACQEGIAAERKLLEWKNSDREPAQRAKAS
jgi:hypothetical protein